MTAVEIVSFGYGHAAPPEAHVILDLRQHFRDPHVNPALRYMTAEDRLVRRAVLRTAGIRPLLRASVRAVRAFAVGPSGGRIVVAVGCVGGRHRSATVAHCLARRLRRRGLEVVLLHRDLRRPVLERAA
ncbi:ATPase [Streptomyces sp. NPDC127074]|uniref:RapZ C-terminal domain-containing protein n=1 Tax=Streptomyces sp. NPDC127074 TaxID=3347130 RepID=UPI00365A0F51